MSHSISLRVMKEYIWPSLSSTFGFLEVTVDKREEMDHLPMQNIEIDYLKDHKGNYYN